MGTANFRSADGCSLMPYQQAGVERLMGCRCLLLGDEMGLGKTAQALTAAHRLGLEAVLVVCPTSSTETWLSESQRWIGRLPLHVQRSVRLAKAPSKVWAVVNWSNLSAVLENSNRHWDCLILDEAHFAKSPRASRTRKALGYWDSTGRRHFGLADRADRLWALSGTPMPNRPIELQPLLACMGLFAQTNDLCLFARSYYRFALKFCNLHTKEVYSPTGRRVVNVDKGASNVALLRKGLEGLMLVRRKADVMQDLPEVRRQIIAVKVSGVPAPPEAWPPQKCLEYAGRGKCPDLAEISSYRLELGTLKAEIVANHVAGSIGEGGCVVFVHHKEVARLVADELGRYGVTSLTVDGDMPAAERQRQVDRFAAGSADVFIGTLGSCGTGLNGLQRRTDWMVVAEPDWSPGLLRQAEGRLHRIGQAGSVLAQYVVAVGDLDSYVLASLVRKMDLQDELGI